MFKRILTILAIGTFAIAGGGAAAGYNHGATLSKDGHVTYLASPSHTGEGLPSFHPRKLKTIFSNFNPKYPNGLYWCCAGLSVMGSKGPLQKIFADAVQFSPTADAKVTEIDAAVGRVSGTSTILLSIYMDHNNIPGKALGSFTADLIQDGTCCILATGKGKAIRIKAGKLYWAVVSTTTPDSDTWASWNFNSVDDLTGMMTTSTNDQGQWQPGQIFAPVPAFAIYGK
jgi:hypothetical protein